MGNKLTDDRSAEEPGVLGVDIESFYTIGMPMIQVIYGRMTRERISGTEHSIIRNYQVEHEINVMRTHRYVTGRSGSIVYSFPEHVGSRTETRKISWNTF